MLIVGAGVIGQVAAQIAALKGARVTICDLDEGRLEVARQIGAVEEVVDVSGNGWEKDIPEAAFNAVIDFAGVPGMEDELLSAARRGGSSRPLPAGRPGASKDRPAYP